MVHAQELDVIRMPHVNKMLGSVQCAFASSVTKEMDENVLVKASFLKLHSRTSVTWTPLGPLSGVGLWRLKM